MFYLATSILLLLSLLLYVKFSYKPQALIKHYEKVLKELGYRVYVQPFEVFGISFFEVNKMNVKLHNDAQYDEQTIFPQVDVIIGNIFDKVFLTFIEPSLGKELLSAQKVSIYPKEKKNIEGIKLIIGEGMVFTEGQSWKNKRKLMSKVFNFDLIRENIPKIAEICDRSFTDFDHCKNISQNQCVYDVSKLSALLFSEIMMKCFLGSNNEVKIEGISFSQFALELITEAGVLSMKPYFVLLGRVVYKLGLTKQVREIKKKVDLFRTKATEILHSRVKQVQEAPVQQRCTDVVQALVYENMNNKSDFSYSEKGLLDELSTFLVAGTDTTTFFFTMMVYFLGKYPNVQEKLRKQINEVIKTDINEEITFQNLKKLTYIDWIQLETTRHYGPANGIFFRQATEDNYLLNVPIKKETILGFQPRGSHYNPKYFKEPNEFRPQRWESQCDNLNPYVFLGFGGGPRSCIGKQLALLESKIALIKLIKRYESIEAPESLTFIQSMLYEPLPFETTFIKAKKNE